ncbi:MAG TPA: VWA domain-containing protein [Candidatus Binataceae bacterium]|nr:VWA domain-containing protein [Candidatus Binataceae bacterium]
MAILNASADDHALFMVKGMLTKFMRMLFPLEFRLDSIANTGATLPFHYPLIAGEMIYLPETVSHIGGAEGARDYYILTAAHLAARHEFGTFEFRLADMPGFEDRGETGVEALDCFVESFEDPALAGALMRLCESARVDAELARHYRGLAPRIQRMNSTLIETLRPEAMSTILVKASLASAAAPSAPGGAGFNVKAREFFAPLREPGSNVTQSAQSTAMMYEWLQALIAAARAAGEGDGLGDRAEQMRNDLIGNLNRPDGDAGDDLGDGADADDGGGETDQLIKMESSGRSAKGKNGRPLTPEELRKLIEQGAQLKPSESSGNADGEGMYLTQLTNKDLQEFDQLREQLGEIGTMPGSGRLMIGRNRAQDSYYAYDEWDYVAADYRRNWCRLREIKVEGDGSDFFETTLQRYSELLPQVRRNFQRIRPASYRMVRGLEDGDEIDFDRTIESRVARRMGEVPDGRVYKARKKEARDVATLFLLDMSASTDEPIHREPPRYAQGEDDNDDWMKAWQRRPQQPQRPRRIIDVNKEALVIMAQSLEEIGDSYAIMGFSGHGRDNVEFYVIKEFDNELSDEVKARVGAVEPKRSTRMGTAIRHVREKFKDVASRAKHVIMLSDGFPQDFDYGHDRRSNAYGIQDTMVALKELEMSGVLPFCITVDRTGHDYLRQMCSSSRYLVIEDITSLPRQLPKVYEQVVRW